MVFGILLIILMSVVIKKGTEKQRYDKETISFLDKAKMYQEENNYEQAIQYYEKAADRKISEAFSWLKLYYANGYISGEHKEQYEKAIKYAKYLARNDEKCFIESNKIKCRVDTNCNGEAKREVGDLYYRIRTWDKDKKNVPNEFHSDYYAMEWYQKAAECGETEAMSRIGDIYYEGYDSGHKYYGVPDYEKALEWYKKSYEKSKQYGPDVYNYYILDIAKVYATKTINKCDDAIKLYNQVIEARNEYTWARGKAYIGIGDIYYNGVCGDKDYQKALEYYKIATQTEYPALRKRAIDKIIIVRNEIIEDFDNITNKKTEQQEKELVKKYGHLEASDKISSVKKKAEEQKISFTIKIHDQYAPFIEKADYSVRDGIFEEENHIYL